MSPKAKVRPAGVPEAAFWSDSDNEWIVQTVDARGRKHGLVRYFRPDGTLCCETEFEADQPHGPFTRYHETGEVSRKGTFARGVQVGLDTTYPASGPTTERGFPPNVSSKIHHYEQEWKDGVLVRRLFVDAKGRHIFPDGKPYPPRPKGVPDGALFECGGWELGAVDRQGTKLGTWIRYNGAGAFLFEDDYEDGRAVRRTYAARSDDDARVAFERGAWQSSQWVGSVSQLDAEHKVLRTFDPTGADDVDDPKLAAWAKRARAIDWSKLESAYGPATLVGVYLVTLGCSKDAAARRVALDKLANATCHQGSIYSASARVIEPLLELVWLRPDDVRQPLLALVHTIAALPAPMFSQARRRKSSDAMVCVKALDAGASRILRGFASLSEPEAVEAITCLSGCFGNEKVAALLRTIANAREGSVRLRAAAITALGNLSIADKKLDADVKPALRDDDVAIRVAAVMGRALGHHRPAKLEVGIMLAALAHADAVRETFAALPFVEDSMEVELAQLLAVAGRLSPKAKTQVVDALLATLADYRGLGALPVALAGLDLLFNPDDDERDHDDRGPPSPEARTFVKALVDKDDLWLSRGKPKKLVDLANALEERALPTDREGLRAWAK